MLPWLFPLWYFAGVALVTISTPLGLLVAMVSGWILFPLAAEQIRAGSRAAEGGNRDLRTDYWRITLH